ncbi:MULTISPECIES: glycerophosphodiester phosphodiesterase family protein [Helcobacillus]|uniref:Glycerophosphoryl diester phosphodiesterase n=1 Tax=Helcobacillus massiliensis TaxID=521392 RepID=A0A839QWQ7_9MICO|nr:glycerophosphodiester phosphodiesterase family protein [Helcobacillus massiliensis]MBB3022421.1 glycerophosphoryl diester phosphodiesterase [Helcobacillus massiliensis]MCG7426936.1 glycerophosphodiester phosphodiesterase [Helcobacillus sp. ACRRO]MDK7741126.1 glycerophosphodiester phosphodiesterase family protein [Helcobacillus massiliensis]WOO93934.1 glycerophosphodiester phosphodiesterase family protein [Helcobacillus massiliensis]
MRSGFMPGELPRGIAHRGFAPDGDENTLEAFHRAVANGADVIETDVHATADGIALTVHDPQIRCGATGDEHTVAESRLQDLRGVRVGGLSPIPTLEDVLGDLDVPVNIDIKAEQAILPTARAIVRAGAQDRVCLAGFTGAYPRRAAAMITGMTGVRVRRSPSLAPMAAIRLADALELPGTDTLLRRWDALQVPEQVRGVRVVTERLIAKAHRAGCEVHVWTVDHPGDMRRLLEMGADGIITNRIDLWNTQVSPRVDRV